MVDSRWPRPGLLKRSELVDLSRVHRHRQELAASLVRDAELSRKTRTASSLPSTQEPRLVEPRRIIDASMDDFAVARTDACAPIPLSLSTTITSRSGPS